MWRWGCIICGLCWGRGRVLGMAYLSRHEEDHSEYSCLSGSPSGHRQSINMPWMRADRLPLSLLAMTREAVHPRVSEQGGICAAPVHAFLAVVSSSRPLGCLSAGAAGKPVSWQSKLPALDELELMLFGTPCTLMSWFAWAVGLQSDSVKCNGCYQMRRVSISVSTVENFTLEN